MNNANKVGVVFHFLSRKSALWAKKETRFLRVPILCGKDRIRTYEPVSPVTRFPGVPLQPLEHLSLAKFLSGCKIKHFLSIQRIFLTFFLPFYKKWCVDDGITCVEIAWFTSLT